MDDRGKLIFDGRKILAVPQGNRGLRQSEAVFQHISNLPDLFAALSKELNGEKILCVAASEKPRNIRDSYMPVFKVGSSFARGISSIMDCPYYPTSHQEGHLQAGIWSSKGPEVDAFLAVHLSGGTTEILLVKTKEGKDRGMDISILGGTTDLHAGQFVDRVGVMLGLPFPAGPHMEELAAKGREGAVDIPFAVNGLNVSFSGPEACAARLVQQKARKEDIALAVLNCIVISLEKIIVRAIRESKLKEVLIVGGVASNRLLRERLKAKFENSVFKGKLYFPRREFSSDNAVGIAGVALKYL